MYDELAPMNVAQMMDRAVEAYKRSFWKQLAYAAVVAVVFFVAAFIVGIVVVAVLLAGVLGGDDIVGVLVVLIAVFLPLMLLWMGVSSAGHILFTRQALVGHLVQLPKLKILPLAFRALTAIIAQVLVFMPIAVFLIYLFWTSIVFFVDAFFLAGFNAMAMGFVLILAVSTLVAVVFLLVENMFALAVTVAMFERRLFFGSLFRSWELVRDDYFKIFATRVLWYLVGVGFALAAQGLMFLFWTFMGVLVGTAHPAFSVLMVPIGMFSTIFPIFVSFAQMPMDGIMRAVIYFNQRIKKEGLDIEFKLHMIWYKRGQHGGHQGI